MTHSPELAEALRYEDSLRRLAWLLHLGGADADDAVQHALTQVALGKRPKGMPLWTFLRTACKHHAFNLRKMANRRRTREAAAVGERTAMPVDEMLARDQLRRRVAEAVIALAEPYRTTVWLRWFEGMDVEGVAAQMQAPTNTVRTRLQRAHAQLKLRLDGEYGDQKWGVLAMPAVLLGASSALPLGTVTAAAATGGVMLAVCAGLFALLRGTDPQPIAVATPVVADVVDQGQALPRVTAPLPRSRSPRMVAQPSSRGLQVTLANRKPAVELPVWWWHAEDRPTWTERARVRPDRERGTDDAYEHAQPEPTSLRTDHNGCIAVPAPRPVAVTVEIAPGIWFSAPLPTHEALVLPALTEVRMQVAANGIDGEWEASVTFVGRTDKAASERFDVDTESGPGAIRYHAQRLQGSVKDPLVATVVDDSQWRWRVDALGHGFLFRPGQTARRAPFRETLHIEKRLPRVVVSVHEPSGELTPRRGVVRLRHVDRGISVRELTAGRAVFDVQDTYGLTPELRVRMHDGEEVTVVANFQAADQERGQVLQLSGKSTAQRVFVEALPRDSLHHVFVETDAAGWMRVAAQSERGHEGEVEFSDDERGLWLVGLPMLAGRQVCVVTKTGRVAFGAFSWLGEAVLPWLPTHQPSTVRVADLYRHCGRRDVLRASLELQLPSSNAPTWMTLWSHQQAPQLDGYVRAPIWQDLTLPTTLPWRLRVYDGPDTSFPVLLERTTLR